MRTKVAATFLVQWDFFAILSPMALQTREIVPNSKNKKSPTPEPQKPLQHLPFSPFSVGVADRCNLQNRQKVTLLIPATKYGANFRLKIAKNEPNLNIPPLAKIKNEHQKNTNKLRKFS